MVSKLSPRRLWNAARKVAAGLPLGGEAVWPGLRNDLFVAHESIYSFVARWARARRVLDAACGTGYGSFLLARAGAQSVVGVDRDADRVRFAVRRYRCPNLLFRVADCERLDVPAESFDLVVSSNTLEHLTRPAGFLLSVGTLLSRDGELVVAVPPVLSEADLREHGTNLDHVPNFSVRGWGDLFESEGWKFVYYSHRCRRPLDFRSFRVSAAAADDFEFVEEEIDAAYESAPITAVFRLRQAR